MRSENGVQEAACQRLIVGISGATGVAFGIRVLEIAGELGIERHLVVTRAGQLTRNHESSIRANELNALAEVVYKPSDVGAVIASGSFNVTAMIVAPCSARTLSAIAYGVGENLLTRAADVTLKERRRLVLLLRETPLQLVHIRAMAAVTESGGIVMPPVPALYLRPTSIGEMVNHTAQRALEVAGFNVPEMARWAGLDQTPK